jgi:hypothetical protein
VQSKVLPGKADRRVARVFESADTTTKWVPRPSRSAVQSHDILYKVSLDILYTLGARSAPG